MVTPLSHDFFELTVEHCLILYLTLHRWPSLRYYTSHSALKLYRAYAEETALEAVALKATTILPILLLQKPHHSSKSREHLVCLERRLTAWNAGDIDTLLQEGRTIQNRLPKAGPTAKDEARTTRAFSKLMLQGKTKAALRLISDHCKGGVLRLDSHIPSSDPETEPQTVREILASKQPPAQPASAETILLSESDPPTVHPVMFDCIDIHPNGCSAYGWRSRTLMY